LQRHGSIKLDRVRSAQGPCLFDAFNGLLNLYHVHVFAVASFSMCSTILGPLATKWFIGRAHLRLWTAFSNNPIGPLCSPLWSRDPPLATPASRISTYSQSMHMPLCPGPDVPVRISYNTRASVLCNFGTKRPIQSSSSKGH